MPKLNFTQPDFFLCEIPIKNGSFNDDRMWVYHRKSLSLIEFIEASSIADFSFDKALIQEVFSYENSDGDIEQYIGVFVQNNCEATEYNGLKVLRAAFTFLTDYFDWEDSRLEI